MRRIVVDSLVALGLVALLIQTYTQFKTERLMRRGDQFSATRQYELATVQYQEAARINPDRYDVLRAIASVSTKAYNPAGLNLRPLFVAQWALNRAVEINPSYPYGWSELGEVAHRLQQAKAPDAPDPENYMRRALEIDPTNPRFLASYMKWQIDVGRRVEAWDTFYRLVDSDPVAIRAYGGRLLRTDADIDRLATHVKGNDDQVIQLARYVYGRSEFDRAETLVRGISAEGKLRPDSASLLASTLRQQNRMEEAEAVLRAAVARYPDDLYIARDLGWLLVYAKKDQAAIELFAGLLTANPRQYWLALEGARAAGQVGNWPQAAAWYEQSLLGSKPGDPSSRDALSGLVNARRKEGQLRAALIASRQLLDLEPENRRYREQVEELQAEVEKQAAASGGEDKP